MDKVIQHKVSSHWNSYLFLERPGHLCLQWVICTPNSASHPAPARPYPSQVKEKLGSEERRVPSTKIPTPSYVRASWESHSGITFFPQCPKKCSLLQWHRQPRFTVSGVVRCRLDFLSQWVLPILLESLGQRMTFRKENLQIISLCYRWESDLENGTFGKRIVWVQFSLKNYNWPWKNHNKEMHARKQTNLSLLWNKTSRNK